MFVNLCVSMLRSMLISEHGYYIARQNIEDFQEAQWCLIHPDKEVSGENKFFALSAHGPVELNVLQNLFRGHSCTCV